MSRYLSATETSKIIRKALRGLYPMVKFSVRTTERGTIYVKWTDGPSLERVKAVAGQFEGKGFDGSIDLAYHIDGWLLDGEIVGTRSRGTEGSRGLVAAWGLEAPKAGAELVSFGAGYIFTERTISPTLANRCIAQIAEYWGGVDLVPVAVEGYSGYTLNGMEHKPIRNDLDSHYYSWSSCIHRAAEDRTAFSRNHD